MRRAVRWCMLLAVLTASCSNPKSPNDANFRRAINGYLGQNDPACIPADTYPTNVQMTSWGSSNPAGLTYAALEAAGLVKSSNAGSFFGDRIKRFELTDVGKQYLKSSPSGNHEFCYATVVVDRIVKWDEPATSDTAVTYTYKLENLAAWASRPEFSKTFDGDKITGTIKGAQKSEAQLPLHLTNQGWEVAAQQ